MGNPCVSNVLVLVAQSCPTLCDPTDHSLPGSSVHGILQARVLEWVVMPSSRGSSLLRNETWVSRIAGRFFTLSTSPPPHYSLQLSFICRSEGDKFDQWLSSCALLMSVSCGGIYEGILVLQPLFQAEIVVFYLLFIVKH